MGLFFAPPPLPQPMHVVILMVLQAAAGSLGLKWVISPHVRAGRGQHWCGGEAQDGNLVRVMAPKAPRFS